MTPTVYKMFNEDGELLYVGCTSNIRTRLQHHQSMNEAWRFVSRVEIEHFEDKGLALRREAELIDALEPALNKRKGSLFAKTEAELADLAEQRKAERERQRQENLPNTHFRFPTVCRNCGAQWTWMPKGMKADNTKCANCNTASLIPRIDAAALTERAA